VNFLNPFYARENGHEFLRYLYLAREGRLDPFILVIEGSIPNEEIKDEGYWAAFGADQQTGQPITTCEWIDRLAPKAWAVMAVGTCATYGGIHAMKDNPTGAMGLPDYLGWSWKSKAEIPIVCVPGCPTQPDNLTETLLYLLYQSAGRAPMFLTGEPLRSVYRVLARDGHTVWFHCEVRMVRRVDGRPWFIHGVGFDITELKRAEEALRASEQMLHGLFEFAPDTVVVVDHCGRIARVNAQVERMFGYKRDELLDQPVEVLLPERFGLHSQDGHSRRIGDAARVGAVGG
jgi:hypothetical protein